MLQESGGDPGNVNKQEGAHGLLQWEGPRWTALQNYALSRNAAPTDPNVQMDFIAHEMSGPEAKAGAAFMAAGDLPSASAALKQYIRFGDNSDAARLRYGQSLLGGNGAAAPGPATVAGSPVAGNSPAASDAQQSDDPAFADALQKISKNLQAPQIQPLQPLVTPAMIRARQMAAAMVSRSLNPGSTS